MRIDIAGLGRQSDRIEHSAFMATVEEIDHLGFDGIWFNEFHFQSPPLPYPSIPPLAAAIFGRTERLRVGTSVIVLSLHEPMQLAEQIAQLDWQSEGRIDIGLGRGTDPRTMRALGIDPDKRREGYETAVQTLFDASAGRLTVTGIDGASYHLPVQPCVQDPHPPVYVAGYTEETLAYAARLGLPLLLSPEPSETRQLSIYRQKSAELERQPRLRESSLSRYVVIGSTLDAAQERFNRFMPALLERRLHYASLRGREPSAVPNPSAEEMLRSQVIMGDPESCGTRLMALVRETGIDAVRCNFNGDGAWDREDALAQIRLFGREVLPPARKINRAPTSTMS